MGYVILLFLVVLCVAGNVEIIKKKYPEFPLVVSDVLMVMQAMAVLGGNGQIGLDENMSIIVLVAYTLGYFVLGILSIIILESVSSLSNNSIKEL